MRGSREAPGTLGMRRLESSFLHQALDLRHQELGLRPLGLLGRLLGKLLGRLLGDSWEAPGETAEKLLGTARFRPDFTGAAAHLRLAQRAGGHDRAGQRRLRHGVRGPFHRCVCGGWLRARQAQIGRCGSWDLEALGRGAQCHCADHSHGADVLG